MCCDNMQALPKYNRFHEKLPSLFMSFNFNHWNNGSQIFFLFFFFKNRENNEKWRLSIWTKTRCERVFCWLKKLPRISSHIYHHYLISISMVRSIYGVDVFLLRFMVLGGSSVFVIIIFPCQCASLYTATHRNSTHTTKNSF